MLPPKHIPSIFRKKNICMVTKCTIMEK